MSSSSYLKPVVFKKQITVLRRLRPSVIITSRGAASAISLTLCSTWQILSNEHKRLCSVQCKPRSCGACVYPASWSQGREDEAGIPENLLQGALMFMGCRLHLHCCNLTIRPSSSAGRSRCWLDVQFGMLWSGTLKETFHNELLPLSCFCGHSGGSFWWMRRCTH